MIEIGKFDLQALKQKAQIATLKRARICLHTNHNDPVQEMVIAVCVDTYIPPHRQKDKYKTYTILEGNLLAVFFDDNGKPTHTAVMGPSHGFAPFICRFFAGQWHTVISTDPLSVYIETIAGPYYRKETEFAPWAPDPADNEAITAWLAVCRREKYDI